VLIRRVAGQSVLAQLRLSKTEMLLIALLEEPRTVSKLMELAPSDQHLLEARIERLVRLGLVERIAETSPHESDETPTWRPVPSHPAPAKPSKVRAEASDDDAVTLRPPAMPMGSSDAPSTGVHTRPTRTIRSPFENIPVRRKSR
jgi:hypothetical protein